MVSTLPYRSFKDRSLGPVTLAALLVVTAVTAAAGNVALGLAQGLAILGVAYCASAPISRLRRRRS